MELRSSARVKQNREMKTSKRHEAQTIRAANGPEFTTSTHTRIRRQRFRGFQTTQEFSVSAKKRPAAIERICLAPRVEARGADGLLLLWGERGRGVLLGLVQLQPVVQVGAERGGQALNSPHLAEARKVLAL